MLVDETESFHIQRSVRSPFSLFAAREGEEISRENPNLSGIDLAIRISVKWSNLTPEQKSVYSDEASAFHSFPFTHDAEIGNQDQIDIMSELIQNAAEQISSTPQPQKYDEYLVWLGAQAVNKFNSAHGYIPSDAAKMMLKGNILGNQNINQQFQEMLTQTSGI